MTIHNPTQEPIQALIFDEVHSSGKLTLSVLPAGEYKGTTTTTTTTTTAAPTVPTEITLKVNSATGSYDLATQKYSYTGLVASSVANGNNVIATPFTVGETLTATATTNAPLPPGWSIQISYGTTLLITCKSAVAVCSAPAQTFPAGSAAVGFIGQLNNSTGGHWGVGIRAGLTPPAK